MSVECAVQEQCAGGDLTPTEKLDLIQAELAQMPKLDCPLKHTFTPGLYTRTIFMEKGAKVVSKIHKTEHPFAILKGSVSVWTEETGWVRYTAPYMGVTKPGTRRLLNVHEDCIWATFHPTCETDLEKIEAVLIEPHEIPSHILDRVVRELISEAAPNHTGGETS